MKRFTLSTVLHYKVKLYGEGFGRIRESKVDRSTKNDILKNNNWLSYRLTVYVNSSENFIKSSMPLACNNSPNYRNLTRYLLHGYTEFHNTFFHSAFK